MTEGKISHVESHLLKINVNDPVHQCFSDRTFPCSMP